MIAGGGPIPWDERDSADTIDRYKSYGLAVGNMMISGFNNAIYARRAAMRRSRKSSNRSRPRARRGLPVVEYNWYAHRAMEGYFEETGRAGAGWTGFDYEREVENNGAKTKFKDLPPLPNEGAHTLDEMWTNITYFLKAVIPEAEKAGRAAGAAPQRSARAHQPRLAADHGHRRGLEEADRNRQEPVERHHLRLRRDARNGRTTRWKSAATSPRATASTTCTSATSKCRSRTSATPKSSSTKARTTCSP